MRIFHALLLLHLFESLCICLNMFASFVFFCCTEVLTMIATASCIVMRSQRHVSSAPDLMTCTWPAGLTQMTNMPLHLSKGCRAIKPGPYIVVIDNVYYRESKFDVSSRSCKKSPSDHSKGRIGPNHTIPKTMPYR